MESIAHETSQQRYKILLKKIRRKELYVQIKSKREYGTKDRFISDDGERWKTEPRIFKINGRIIQY